MNAEQKNSQLSLLHTVALWCTVAVSISTLCLVVWRGGVLAATVDTDSRRIDRLEQDGSSSLKIHVKSDDDRIADLKAQVQEIKTALKDISSMQKDISEMKTAMEFLTGKRGTMQRPATDGKPTAGGYVW